MEWRCWIESEPIEGEGWARRVDVLLESLEGDPAVLGPVGWGSGQTLGAVFEIAGADAQHALVAGVAAFDRALEATTAGGAKPQIRRLEITDAAFEPDELVGATDIARLLGISRQRVYQLSSEATFPTPAAHLARGALWSRADIEAWSERRKIGA